jgi:hypothetical protein
MAREKTEGPELYAAGTLRPTFLPNQSSKNPAEAETVTATPEERRVHVNALEAERAAWARRQARLHGDLSRARTDCARIREQLTAAEHRARDAEIALAAATADHDAAVIGHERALRATAPALIDEVQIFLRDQLAALHQPGALRMETRRGARDVLTLRRREQVYSNAESIGRRQQAIQAALRTWDGFRLAAHDPAELQALAAALPASLPAVDGSIEAPIEPMLTIAEVRELEWRLAEQREGSR